MAKYYSYDEHQFRFPRLSTDNEESCGSSYDSDEELNHKLIPTDWNVKFGDIIAMNDYRDTRTIFIGIDNKVIKNPDYSCSGYLSIPLEITKWLFDAYWYYKKIFLNKEQPCVSIDLKPDDQWVINKFGKALPEEWKIRLWYNWGEFEHIAIEFTENDSDNRFFDMSVTYDQLMECYTKLKEKQFTFTIHYKINNTKDIKRLNEYKKQHKLDLPITFTERFGGGQTGHNWQLDEDFEDTKYNFSGPKSDMLKAYKIVKNYYNKYNGTLDFHISEPIEKL